MEVVKEVVEVAFTPQTKDAIAVPDVATAEVEVVKTL